MASLCPEFPFEAPLIGKINGSDRTAWPLTPEAKAKRDRNRFTEIAITEEGLSALRRPWPVCLTERFDGEFG